MMDGGHGITTVAEIGEKSRNEKYHSILPKESKLNMLKDNTINLDYLTYQL